MSKFRKIKDNKTIQKITENPTVKKIVEDVTKTVEENVVILDDKTKFKYSKADKFWPHDDLVEKMFLWMIPRSVTPNQLTAFRFIATPGVAALTFYENYIYGLIAFLLVALSDVLDGTLARKRSMITEWGKVYDPIADKILIGSMVYIIALRYIDFWTAILIIGIEIPIVFFAWLRKREGGKVEANLWGKIKMHLQVLGVVFLLLAVIYNIAALLPIASGALYISIAFAIVTLLTHGI